MPATAKTPLGANTINRKWYLDVDTSSGATIVGTADATTDVITATAHGMANGQTVSFTGTPPTGLVVGTVYYVRDATANNFKVAATSGGVAIDLTAAGGPFNVVVGPSWVGVFGISDFQPALDTTMQDDSDYDSEGYRSSTATAIGWSLTMTLQRKATTAAANAYDSGQETLRLVSDDFGTANRVHVRWYEMNGTTGPKIEAYEGYASVSWSPNGGPMDALSNVAVTLQGQGKRTAITHPAA